MLEQYTIGGKWVESMSDEEFFTFCEENRNLKFEREPDGQIIIMPPTGFNTGNRNSEINFHLRLWNKKHQLGQVIDSDTGFYLPNGAMRNPDAGWVSNERLATVPAEELEKFPHLVPDFVVELVSKSDYPRNLHVKMKEWVENGCRLGWLIDPYKETVTVFKPNQEPRLIGGFDKQISGEDVLPGFVLKLGELR